jgi:hypothetical protein
MDIYPESYDVTLSVPVQDPAGRNFNPDSVTATLYDQDDEMVADLGSVPFVSGQTSLDITVPRANLTVPLHQRRAAFTLRVTFMSQSGSFPRTIVFAVERDAALRVMTNSFLTFARAEMLAVDHTNADGWHAAEESARKHALVEAFVRLQRIPMQFTPRDDEGNLLPDKRQVIPRDLWPKETRADFDAYPEHFRNALRMAQFVEADNILRGEIVARKRAEGIVEEEVHESRMEISPTVVSYDICEAAMVVLAGYVDFDIRVGRA